MFSLEEIRQVIGLTEFHADFGVVRQLLVNSRFAQVGMFDEPTTDRLQHFVEALLASAPHWAVDDPSICQRAAEIAELLSISPPCWREWPAANAGSFCPPLRTR